LKRKKLDYYVDKKKAQKEAEESIWHKANNLVVSLRNHYKGAAIIEEKKKKKNAPSTTLDFGTVATKIESRIYAHPGEVAKDVRLIWTSTRVLDGAIGKKAYKVFEQFEVVWAKLAKLEGQWLEVQQL
jgi:hypothetical protein